MSIDIIIPCQNPTDVLMKTIESLQFISEIDRILIIDDFSVSGKDIFKKSKLFDKVYVKKNIYKKGISGALNTGIKFSNNIYIGRIDCGDICINKKRFQKIIKLFSENKNIDLVCSGLIGTFNKKIIPKLYYINNQLTPFSKVPHPTWIIKRNSIKYIYKSNCYRFEDYSFLLDNKFNIFIIKESDIRYETKSKLRRFSEMKVSIKKSLYYIKNSNYRFISILIGLTYIFCRIIRLILSNKKIVF